jgi:hypothetical protein
MRLTTIEQRGHSQPRQWRGGISCRALDDGGQPGTARRDGRAERGVWISIPCTSPPVTTLTAACPASCTIVLSTCRLGRGAAPQTALWREAQHGDQQPDHCGGQHHRRSRRRNSDRHRQRDRLRVHAGESTTNRCGPAQQAAKRLQAVHFAPGPTHGVASRRRKTAGAGGRGIEILTPCDAVTRSHLLRTRRVNSVQDRPRTHSLATRKVVEARTWRPISRSTELRKADGV